MSTETLPEVLPDIDQDRDEDGHTSKTYLPLYKVIMWDDDVTTMEFVIETLLDIFDYNPTSAEEITVKIHDNGSAVVALLPFELAEQKGIEVTVLARGRGFPLQVKVERE